MESCNSKPGLVSLSSFSSSPHLKTGWVMLGCCTARRAVQWSLSTEPGLISVCKCDVLLVGCEGDCVLIGASQVQSLYNLQGAELEGTRSGLKFAPIDCAQANPEELQDMQAFLGRVLPG